MRCDSTKATRKRRSAIAAALATLAFAVTLSAAQAAPDARRGIQAPGDPVRLGVNNDGGTAETLVRSDPTGDKATLAVFNEATSCPPPCTTNPDSLRVFAGDFGGAAIQAFAGSGTFSTLNLSGIAVRGIGTRTGVWGRSPGIAGTGLRGESTGAGGNGVWASGPRAILAEGGAEGILSTCGNTGCVALKSSAPANGFGLQASGRVDLSTAAIAVVPSGQDRLTVSPGFDIHSDTKVLVTPMSGGGAFKFVSRDFAADTLTFRLGKNATNDVTLAYFVIG